MNEELQHKLTEILSAIQSATGKAADFTLSQLPDIAQSYVSYARTTATIDAIVWSSIFGCALYVSIVKGFKNVEAVEKDGWSKGEWLAERILAAGVGAMTAVVSAACAFGAISHAALVWIAPKVWLLKELGNLVK